MTKGRTDTYNWYVARILKDPCIRFVKVDFISQSRTTWQLKHGLPEAARS